MESGNSLTYKNLKLKHKHSPVELKEKLRKDYKSKVQNCRDMLINRFREATGKPDFQSTLTEIYKNLYDFSDPLLFDDDESEILGEIKDELIQEELNWWLEEYEKSNHDIDWSVMHQEENVICPICQITNFEFVQNEIVCPNCKITIKSDKPLSHTKKVILDIVEKHNMFCRNKPQFSVVIETCDSHIYLICDACEDMQLVI